MVDSNLEFVLLWCGEHPFLFIGAAMIFGIMFVAVTGIPSQILKNWPRKETTQDTFTIEGTAEGYLTDDD